MITEEARCTSTCSAGKDKNGNIVHGPCWDRRVVLHSVQSASAGLGLRLARASKLGPLTDSRSGTIYSLSRQGGFLLTALQILVSL